MAADGSIIINTRLNTDGFREGTADMKRSFAGLGGSIKKIGVAIAGAFAVEKIIEFGKTAIELGSDLQEVQNVVDSVFTTMSNRVDEFAKNAAATAGLSETMAKRYTGTFGAMAKSFGFAENEAFEMSAALTQLTGDVASFYNITQDMAYTKLKSVFTGEAESLKELGVVMTQSALDAYAMANGYGKTTSAMTEQEKVALRYRFVLDQLSTASGDFIRTADGWANQVRVLKLQVDSLKATIGSGLINLFTPVIKVINILLAKLATVANGFKAFTELITGNKSSGAIGTANAGLDASVYNDMADGAQGVADATDNITKSTKKAEKAQKSYLSGLDEIRRFGEEDISPITGGGATGGTGAGIGNVNYGTVAEGETVFEKTETAIDRVLKRLKDLQKLLKKGFWDGLGDYKPILKELQKDIDSIKVSLTDIFTSDEVTESASDFADTFAYSIGKIGGSFSGIGLNVASLFVGGFESYLSNESGRIKQYIADMFDIGSEVSVIAADFANALSVIFSGFTGQEGQEILGSVLGIFSEMKMGINRMLAQISRDVFGLLTQPFIDNSEKIKKAITDTLAVIQPIIDSILLTVQSLSDKFDTFYNEHLKPFLDDIGEDLSYIWGLILDGYNMYILPVIERLSALFTEFLNGPFGDMVDDVVEFLATTIDNLNKLWNETLVPFIEWWIANVLPVIVPVLDKIIQTVFSLLTAVTKTVGGAIKILQGLITFLTGIFTGDWEQAFKGMEEITNGFEKQVGAVFGLIEDTILAPFSKFMQSVFEKDWSESFGALGKKMNEFFDDVELGWKNVKGFFEDIISFIKNIFAGNWLDAWEFVVRIFKGIFEKLIGFAKTPVNNVIGLINGLINALNSALSGIEKAFSFSYDFKNPFTGTRYQGCYGLDLPSINTIPYLAKGAVIPPNAPFVAMLGDQRNGNNIEAPEGLIRQIMREELSGLQNNGANYQFTAQINRRTLFDEFIEEAKVRQMATGRNPLELA
jgi:hypothetical protein